MICTLAVIKINIFGDGFIGDFILKFFSVPQIVYTKATKREKSLGYLEYVSLSLVFLLPLEDEKFGTKKD